MRINNPKSIVGFQRSTNADELAYNLATVGQVQTAIGELKDSVYKILTGIGPGANGAGGIGTNFTPNHGYAWLNGEGKVDVTLLPALAITETHVVKQDELKGIQNLPTTSTDPNNTSLNINNILDLWVKGQISGPENIVFQEGDIIIVATEVGQTPDPVYAGSYIITKVPEYNTTGDYQFSKLAYTDGNIVKINDISPKNSAGELKLYLYDILKERYIDESWTITSGQANAANAASALEKSVYRLVTLDEGDQGFRFAFIDDSDAGGGTIVPYTKLSEFDAEKASTVERFNSVNEAINALTVKHDNELSALTHKHTTELTALEQKHDTDINNLSGEVFESISTLEQKHDTELATLEQKHDTDINSLSGEVYETISTLEQKHDAETSFISSTIGKSTDAANSELSASIFAQTKYLRETIAQNTSDLSAAIDGNYTAFLTTESLTNDMLSKIHNNVKNLYYGLEKRAVRLYVQPFIWNESNAQVQNYDTTSPLYKYQVSSSDVSGVIHWTYTHAPVNEGTTITGDSSNHHDQGISNLGSEERVLAVYDENGSLINVDIQLVKNTTTGLTDTIISVDTEFIGRDENTNKLKNSLENKQWTLLIGKTISGIEVDTVDLINV